MGEIKKLLAGGQLEPRVVEATRFFTDLCENVHIHYRNIRLDLSAVELAYWRSGILNMGMAMEKTIEKYNWREGDPNFLVMFDFNFPVSANSDYYPNRMSIELQRDNTVHVHYRDLRLHLTESEFMDMAKMFGEALERYRERTEFPLKDVQEVTRAVVPIDSVIPWDNGHKPLDGEFEKYHREGIEHCKKLILEGKKIRPILVDAKGQRLDGFKRYFAFKELGYKEIEVIVDPNPSSLPGGQNNQGFEDDE